MPNIELHVLRASVARFPDFVVLEAGCSYPIVEACLGRSGREVS